MAIESWEERKDKQGEEGAVEYCSRVEKGTERVEK